MTRDDKLYRGSMLTMFQFIFISTEKFVTYLQQAPTVDTYSAGQDNSVKPFSS